MPKIKIRKDKDGRNLYIHGHSVSKGGDHFCCRTKDVQPLLVGNVKERLEELLRTIVGYYQLPDLYIRIYPTHFHMIFGSVLKHISYDDFANAVLTATNGKLCKEFGFSEMWDNEYLFTGFGDNSPEAVERYFKKLEEGPHEKKIY